MAGGARAGATGCPLLIPCRPDNRAHKPGSEFDAGQHRGGGCIQRGLLRRALRDWPVAGAGGVLARGTSTGTRPAPRAGPGKAARCLQTARRDCRDGHSGNGIRRSARRTGDPRHRSRVLHHEPDRAAAAGGGQHRTGAGGAGAAPPIAEIGGGRGAPATCFAPAQRNDQGGDTQFRRGNVAGAQQRRRMPHGWLSLRLDRALRG